MDSCAGGSFRGNDNTQAWFWVVQSCKHTSFSSSISLCAGTDHDSKIGENEKASTMAFYIQLNFVAVSGLMGLIFGDGHLADPSQPTLYYLFRPWTIPSWRDGMIIIGIGLINGLAAYFISQAYRISKAGIIAPFEYVALPLSIFWSITIFGDWPDIVSWLGIVLIAGAGLYVVYNESVQDRKNVLYGPMPRNR